MKKAHFSKNNVVTIKSLCYFYRVITIYKFTVLLYTKTHSIEYYCICENKNSIRM